MNVNETQNSKIATNSFFFRKLSKFNILLISNIIIIIFIVIISLFHSYRGSYIIVDTQEQLILKKLNSPSFNFKLKTFKPFKLPITKHKKQKNKCNKNEMSLNLRSGIWILSLFFWFFKFFERFLKIKLQHKILSKSDENEKIYEKSLKKVETIKHSMIRIFLKNFIKFVVPVCFLNIIELNSELLFNLFLLLGLFYSYCYSNNLGHVVELQILNDIEKSLRNFKMIASLIEKISKNKKKLKIKKFNKKMKFFNKFFSFSLNLYKRRLVAQDMKLKKVYKKTDLKFFYSFCQIFSLIMKSAGLKEVSNFIRMLKVFHRIYKTFNESRKTVKKLKKIGQNKEKRETSCLTLEKELIESRYIEENKVLSRLILFS